MKTFWDKVDIKSDVECWQWNGIKNITGFPYGRVRFMGKQLLAHRLSWILKNGNIPKGMHVLHKCDNPSCVNPSHLFLGTHKDNMMDCVLKKRNAQSKKKICPKGHPYEGDNLYINKNGARVCKACNRAAALAWKYKNNPPKYMR